MVGCGNIPCWRTNNNDCVIFLLLMVQNGDTDDGDANDEDDNTQ